MHQLQAAQQQPTAPAAAPKRKHVEKIELGGRQLPEQKTRWAGHSELGWGCSVPLHRVRRQRPAPPPCNALLLYIQAQWGLYSKGSRHRVPGLLATIVFGNLASARLFDLTDETRTCPCFDLTDGTTTCPVSALDITAPCTKTLPQYEKSVMALSAQFFFYATGYLCLPMMLSIISMCTVADFSLKFITDEKDVKLFLTFFRRVLHVDIFGFIIVFEFLGMHFGSLMLFHINFSASALLLVTFRTPSLLSSFT